MKFKLKTDGKVKYSKGELAAFKTLTDKARSSTLIVEKIYGGDIPHNGRKIVIGMLNSLRKKMAANRESFKLCNTKRSGPHAMQFWLEAK